MGADDETRKVEERIANLEAFKARVVSRGSAVALALTLLFGFEWFAVPRRFSQALQGTEVGQARDKAKAAAGQATDYANQARSASEQLLASISLPIGSIVAWHRDAGHPRVPLPHGWRECDGSSISLPAGNPLADRNSVFQLPDLNHTPKGYSDGGRFLRGGEVSGKLQDGTIVSGITEVGGQGYIYIGNHKNWRPEDVGSSADAIVADESRGRYRYKADAFESTEERADGYRPRPVNMSVVWIMRVE